MIAYSRVFHKLHSAKVNTVLNTFLIQKPLRMKSTGDSSMNLNEHRIEYNTGVLNMDDFKECPFAQFKDWFERATELEKFSESNAMAISTSTPDGHPSLRYVLLKEVDAKGFVFFSHYDSKKGQQIESNPNVAALFYWPMTHRQVRVEGIVEKIPEAESDLYFKSRPIGSQISGMVSPQSHVLENNKKDTLKAEIESWKERVEKEGEQIIQRPKNWGGYRIIPKWFEFWQGQRSRFHDRFEYVPNNQGGWKIQMLAP